MKDRVLQLLKNSNNFLSGEALSRQLGVTRAAVWKMISALRDDGYPIDATTNRGYRLHGDVNILSEFEIRDNLDKANLLGSVNQIIFEKVMDSTNVRAKLIADKQPQGVSLVVAECQSAGRGRHGKHWLSNDEQGLWFSILLRPEAESAALSRITLFAGLCVVEALDELGAAAGIKWPNDIIAVGSGRKLGGILTEITIEENTVTALIIGIGLNIGQNHFADELKGIATSLRLESNCPVSRVDVLTAILSVFIRRYPTFDQPETWLADYRRRCLTLNRDIQVITAGGETFSGRAVDLDAAGELIVEDAAGLRHTVRSGEVSVRGLLGYS